MDHTPVPDATAGTRAPAGGVETTRAPASLRGKVTRGIGWRLVGQTSAQLTSTAVAIVLAHLLSPETFGLAGMALVLAGITGVFTDLALGAALVQRGRISELDRSTAFWTSLGVGLTLTLVGIGVSPFVADFFSNPAVGPLFAATSTLFLLNSLAVTQSALLTREMDFRSLELRGILASVVAGVAAIALAFLGAGAWAIVGRSVIAGAVSAVLLWRLSSWRPRFAYSRKSLRSLGSYSAKTLLSQFLGYLTLNMDNLLIGRFLDATALGIYSVAYNVMYAPIGRLSDPISSVAFSGFAKLQDDPPRLRKAWLRANRIVAAVMMPAFLGIVVTAPDLVPAVLGDKWHPAVPVLQLLSLAGVARSIHMINWSVVQAVGRPGVMLAYRIFSSALVLAAFAVGLRWGVVGVAGLFAAARLIVVPLNIAITCRVLACPLRYPLRDAAHVAALSLTMALAVYAARHVLVAAGVQAGARLAILVSLGLVAYLSLVRVFAPDLLSDVRSVLRRRSAGSALDASDGAT